MSGPRNLSAERTRFIGRTGELSALEAALRAGGALLTVVGPGGGGKTRLLRELGRNAAAGFSGGAWFCDLAEARTAEQLWTGLARSLELEIEPEDDAGQRLALWLGSNEPVLLLLDNCEQLDASARAALARVTGHAGSNRFVATAREPLGTPGERLFELAPMALGDAVALFVERAAAWDQRLAQPDARPDVERVVERLDRLPLAIELAAARLDVLSTAQLLERLESPRGVAGPPPPGSPPRHASLQALLAWSWESLDERERELLQQLCLFRSGASLGAVAVLSGSEERAVELVGALRRRSLLAMGEGAGGEPRYSAYGVVRAFVEGRLASDAREALERSHADAVLQAVRALGHQVDRAGEAAALERLADEQENLLAIDERFAARTPPLAADALRAITPVLLLRGPVELHLARLDRLLEVLDGDDPAFGPLLLARGEARRLRGQLDAARDDFESVFSRPAARFDPLLTGEGLRRWAMLEGARGRPLEALQRVRRALKLARHAPDVALEARALGTLGAVQQSLGRLDRALSAHARALALLRREGSERLVGVELSYLAVATHRLGHAADAEVLHRQALAIHRQLKHRRFEAVELTHLGYLAHELGDLAESRARYAEGLKIFGEVGDVLLQGVAQTFLGRMELEAGTPEAESLLERALASHRTSNHARLEATTLTLLGHLRRDRGDRAGAIELYRRSLERSAAVEVGFETLVEAWWGEAERGSGSSRPELFDGALMRAARHRNPVYLLAARVLAGEAVAPAELRGPASRSSELRRAMRLARVTLSPPGNLALTVSEGGEWLAREDGARVDLARRRAVRRVLLALTKARLERPGEALSWESLLQAGWPGEHPVSDSGLKRVYTAVWTLRKAGLEGVLKTRGDGYLLDPSALVSWAASA